VDSNGSAMKKKITICSLICILVLTGCAGLNKESNTENGPDVVSSISTNQDQMLTIVANQNKIMDKEAFAKELIQRCLDNDFHTIKFCFEEGYPTSLDMNVYLWKEDIHEKDPVMKVSYKPKEWNKGYDIKNNPEQFELVITE